jgi:pimeloyl-ACP methyl ester carboxylesterase
MECLTDSAHFVKDLAATAVRRTLRMTGLVDPTSPTSFYPQAPARRPPKIVPWKLMLPQALSCGEVLPYTLEDMALDALALLDVLGVRRAHVFGISMGGMISQHMALIAPERVLTLTCIMSSTNAQDLPHPAWWVKLWMLRKPASNVNREQLVEFRMKALQGLLYGCVPVDEDYLKKRIAMSLNRSSYADGLLRQAAAIMRAPSRDADLTRVIRCPCLVIHGQNDVLCRVEHGYRLAKVLTNSKFVVFKNMGHYLNPAYFDAIVLEFLALAERGRLYEAAEQERQARQMKNCNRVSTRYEDVV